MNKKLLLVSAVAIFFFCLSISLAIALVLNYDKITNSDNNSQDQNEMISPTPIETDNNDVLTHPMITVTSPTPHSEVTSPITVTGEAMGSWFFEASFPIKIVDEEGNTLGTGFAMTSDDWMTEDFISFAGEITFDANGKTKGKIIFMRDNPSGLPANNDSFELPVSFTEADAMLNLKVFFQNSDLNPSIIDCTKVFPVQRTVPYTSAVGMAALQELIKGPSASEEANNYFTTLPDVVTINSLTIQNGTAYVDFANNLQEGVGGSCATSTIRSQIEETLKQFPSVNNVVLSIEGETELILQP